MKLIHSLVVLFFCIATISYAAPALKSNICILSGEVISIEKRIQDRGKTDSWIESWGLSKYEEYNDVAINIDSFSHDNSGFGYACKGNGIHIFQISDENLKYISVGSRLNAKAIFSGDEFSIGTWLFEINTSP